MIQYLTLPVNSLYPGETSWAVPGNKRRWRVALRRDLHHIAAPLRDMTFEPHHYHLRLPSFDRQKLQSLPLCMTVDERRGCHRQCAVISTVLSLLSLGRVRCVGCYSNPRPSRSRQDGQQPNRGVSPLHRHRTHSLLCVISITIFEYIRSHMVSGRCLLKMS
jgi:hypothetical protein